MLINGIEAVHFEPTARCNAKCPMCSRTNNENILSNQGEITIGQFKKFFSPEFIKGLKQFKFCGNYGDPIIAKDLLPMHEYLYKHNPNIKFIMSTNGGIRSEKLWTEMAKYYSDESTGSYIQWHIDGLEDTNHIYRIGVKWNKLMKNAKAFLDAGGIGAWFFIPFFHNEHQVEEAEKLANEMGFKEFVIKISARFNSFKKPFTYEGGKLYPPTADRFNIEDKQVKGDLICVSEARKEIYVDAWGDLWPCCWTASASKKANWQIENNLNDRKLRDILDDTKYDKWVNELYDRDTSVCNRRCTGSMMHIIEIDNVQKPQKELWTVG